MDTSNNNKYYKNVSSISSRMVVRESSSLSLLHSCSVRTFVVVLLLLLLECNNQCWMVDAKRLYRSSRIIDITTCRQIQTEIDAYKSIDAIFEYLKLYVSEQRDLYNLYACLGRRNRPQRIPTDYMPSNATYIYGDGCASTQANGDIPFWNRFQYYFFRQLWTGKVMQKSGRISTILNVMPRRKLLKYNATVYRSKSIEDGFATIVMDYRNDTTTFGGPGLLLPHGSKQLRDEMREIIYKNKTTGVYLGRAYIFNASIDLININTAYQNLSNYYFALNFALDFRPSKQNTIPNWTIPLLQNGTK